MAALCACGGGGSGPGSVTGTIQGDHFKIVDAISWPFMYTDSSTGATSTQAQVFLSTTPDLCGAFEANTFDHSVEMLSFGIADTGQTVSAPTAPGKYTVVSNPMSLPPKSAFVSAIVLDMTCMPTTAATATSGTVTITGVKPNVFAGSFDVKLDSGEHITGNFSPDACSAIQTFLDSTTTPTCT
jgi:hypothetical protein